MPRITDWLTEKDQTWQVPKWTNVLGYIAMVWVYAFLALWIGYLTLSFFGLLPDLPGFSVPQVPLVPGFNDNLGDILEPTTQTTLLP